MPDTKETVITEYQSKNFGTLEKEQKRLADLYADLATATAKADKEQQKVLKTQIRAQKVVIDGAKAAADAARAQDKYTKAQDRASGSSSKLEQRLGKLSSFGRNLRQAGGFLGNDTIMALGDAADGFGDIAESIDSVQKAISKGGGLKNALKEVGAIAATAVGPAAIGLGIAGIVQGGQQLGGAFGALQRQQAGGFNQAQSQYILNQFQQQGFGNAMANLQQIIADADKITVNAQDAQINASNAVFDFKRALGKNAPQVNDIASRTFGAIGGLLNGTGLGLGGQSNQYSQAAQEAFKRQQNAQQWQQTFNRLSNLRQQQQGLMQAGNTLRIGTAGAQNAYQAALYNIERETGQKRAEIARQYAQSLIDFDAQYYKERAKVAANYDIETQRAEADHQKQMRRLGEDHQSRLKKLAESRDALAIEDEIESYNKERNRAEDDYQDRMRLQSEDFARQLRDLEEAHRDQRAEKQRANQEQLRDLQMQANQRRQVEYANYQLLLGDLVKAFQDARAQYAASVTNNNTSNTTNNNNANINVSPRYGGERDIAEAVYGAVVQAFGG